MIIQVPFKINLIDARAAAEEMAKTAYSFGISLMSDQEETTDGAVCDFCGNVFEAAPPKKCPICGSKIDKSAKFN